MPVIWFTPKHWFVCDALVSTSLPLPLFLVWHRMLLLLCLCNNRRLQIIAGNTSQNPHHHAATIMVTLITRSRRSSSHSTPRSTEGLRSQVSFVALGRYGMYGIIHRVRLHVSTISYRRLEETFKSLCGDVFDGTMLFPWGTNFLARAHLSISSMAFFLE